MIGKIEIKKYIKEKVLNLMKFILDENAKNIERELQRIALRETAEFILKEKNLSKASIFNNKFELLSYCIQNIKVDGLILEFGVYKGETINFIASKLRDKVIYGFDSFEGLPEDWRSGFSKGTFFLGNLPQVEPNVNLIKGWFDKTLPEFIKENNIPVAFVHIDCDLYSSTKIIFNILKKNIVPGTIIVFDEFFNYPGWKNGEYKAFMEFVDESKVDYEYLGYVKNHEQVAIIIKHV